MGDDLRDTWEEFDDDRPCREPIRRAVRPPRQTIDGNRSGRRERVAARRPETESFRCGHCRSMVGPTVGGGRHRNHCPYCLHSRHVDERRPGDRASGCRATMQPIGVLTRRSGEQVLVHRCLGCGVERHNRVAADDDPLVLMRMPLLDGGGAAASGMAAAP